jgi:hypothetical protein
MVHDKAMEEMILEEEGESRIKVRTMTSGARKCVEMIMGRMMEIVHADNGGRGGGGF